MKKIDIAIIKETLRTALRMSATTEANEKLKHGNSRKTRNSTPLSKIP
jgi:hypothetical protein